ncbi:TPA: hypothetical protein MH541_07155 [Klebsiella pneumoniae]|nr:hypothetical protein [Klebsiella pneumoniae]HBY0093666.1 hypothetical protein [Klebsiella pneumoniae]
MLSLAAANVGFVILKLPASGAGAFVCFCQLVCQFCQTGVKNASAEALRTCADFFAGWRLTPYPAYGPCGLPLIYSPFLLARARGYMGRRRLAAPCALPALCQA